MNLEPAPLDFAPDGTPFSPLYGDVYHTSSGGVAQARHVFLAGNDLPARWQGRQHFVIAETGFGLGVNFLTTWQAWRSDPQACHSLHFVSLEKHPLRVVDLARTHAALPDLAGLADLSGQLCAQWPPLRGGEHRLEFAAGRLTLTLFFGDAALLLPQLQLQADAFYLDGFSPALNPDLWSPELCRQLAQCAAREATLATWSVAGHVRRALQNAGFLLEKRPGFSGKRQMLAGKRMRDIF